MERKLRQVAGFGLAMSLAMCFGLPTAASASPSPSAGRDYANDAVANALAAKGAQSLIASLAERKDYVGTRITADGIVVSMVGRPTDSDKARAREMQADLAPALRTALGDTESLPVRFESVARSESDLDALTAKILLDVPDWEAKGVELSTWGPNPLTNSVEVSMKNYNTTFAELITEAYGEAVSVNPVDVGVSPSPRTSDTKPWYGGSLIKRGSTSCTSWFPATRNSDGKTVMLTAGHCGSGTWTQDGAAFGTTSKLSLGGRGDEQVIPVTSNAARIYSDPTSNSRRVSSVAASDPVGTLLCTDGYTDREVCNVKITAIGQVVKYPSGVSVTGLVKAQQTQGKNAFSGGGSGGPVGATSGSDAISAYGMIAARDDATASIGFYMPARFIQQDMGIKVKTG